MNEEELKSLAKQLSCPNGEAGIGVGQMMNDSNSGMTAQTIQALNLNPNEAVLELGHGNCGHLPEILKPATGIHYTGLEVSETMHEQALMLNTGYVSSGQAAFILYDGNRLPFAQASFDKIMTVNTIYFWNDPVALLKEVYRVLKPGGLFCVTFAQKSFMQLLPFTRYGFTLYDTPTIQQLAVEAGFQLKDVIDQRETITSKAGDYVTREFSVVCVTKN